MHALVPWKGLDPALSSVMPSLPCPPLLLLISRWNSLCTHALLFFVIVVATINTAVIAVQTLMGVCVTYLAHQRHKTVAFLLVVWVREGGWLIACLAPHAHCLSSYVLVFITSVGCFFV